MPWEALSDSVEQFQTVNYHLLYACNMSCGFCFATFLDTRESGRALEKEQALEVVDGLCHANFGKINFAGGEPTLAPHLPDLIRAAKLHGRTTSIVTNGSRLTEEWLDELAPYLDIIALSIDSVDPEIQLRIGRVEKGDGKEPISADHYRSLAEAIHNRGIRLKVNTVVNAHNLSEELWPFIKDIQRWKIFQVLPVSGQNDADIEEFKITQCQFESYVERNRVVENDGVRVVPENNELMTASYVMVDPWGRFFDNSAGQHKYSEPILDVGVDAALSQVTFDSDRFVARGGIY